MKPASETCFHCGLPNDPTIQYVVEVNGKAEYFCCPGCQAVCESILSMGLGDYYEFRENLPETSPRDRDIDLDELLFFDHQSVQDKYITNDNEHARHIALMISGIVCSACTWLIESRINKLKGVLSITVNQSTSRAKVSWDPDQIQLSDILKAINDLGYEAQPYDQRLREQDLIKEKKQYLQKLAIAGIGMMQVMMYSLGFYFDLNQEMSASNWALLRWVSLLISTPVVFYAGSTFYLSAFKSLKNRAVNMDVPVTLAIFSAWFASTYATLIGRGEVYFDSVTMFVFFLLTGRYLQSQAIHRSGRALDERLGTRPETAIRIQGTQQQRVLLDELVPGDKVLVKPGSQVPCDGEISDSDIQVDESIITGESMPIWKHPGDRVAAGSINVGHAFELVVVQSADKSTLANIIKLLQQARENKPKIQQFADRIARYFVSVILVLALASAIYWWSVDPSQVFAIVLSVLVITCPCALSLATPVAITTALGRLTSWSVLVNNSSALFNLGQLTDIVFDKTGTLTTGKFKIEHLVNHSNLSDQQVLALMAAIESRSEHPLATAFDEVEWADMEVKSVKFVPGKGLEAFLDSDRYLLGNKSVLAADYATEFEGNTAADGTHLYLVSENQCLAECILTAEIRSEADEVIRALSEQGMAIHLLSGDKQDKVEAMAEHLAIDKTRYRAEALPEDKLDYITKLQATGRKVGMIGDGLNDSPAMAVAAVSVAMSKSTDITKVNADLILLTERISLITKAYQLSVRTGRIIKQNLAWAFGYNMLGVPLAMSGYVTPWIAAIGMSASSLVVVLNALRLSRDI